MQCTINTKAAVGLVQIQPGETFAIEIDTPVGRKAQAVCVLTLNEAGVPVNEGAISSTIPGRFLAPSVFKCRLVTVIAVPAQCPLKLRTGMTLQVSRELAVTPVAPANPIAFAAMDGAA